MTLLPYLKLMRPKQWVKNLLVFAPAFFAATIFHTDAFVASLAAFATFSLAASAMYVMNDIVDCEQDKKHPKKCLRPLPAGKAKVQHATILSILLALVAAGIAWHVLELLPALATYVALNLAYSFFLKRVAVVDIVLVAFFYVLRVVAGGAASHTPLSSWIILATFFLALFLISGKRRGEMLRTEKRSVLKGYAPETLVALLVGSTILSLASYSLWVVLIHPSDLALYSIIVVAAVLFRMLNILFLHPEKGEEPETLVFIDRWVLLLTLLWALVMGMLFYA